MIVYPTSKGEKLAICGIFLAICIPFAAFCIAVVISTVYAALLG